MPTIGQGLALARGLLKRYCGTCLEINKGIIWWISSVLVRKPLTDIHVAVAILDKGDVVESKCVPAQMSGICSLQGESGVLYYVLSDQLIDNIDAFVAGSPRNVATS